MFAPTLVRQCLDSRRFLSLAPIPADLSPIFTEPREPRTITHPIWRLPTQCPPTLGRDNRQLTWLKARPAKGRRPKPLWVAIVGGAGTASVKAAAAKQLFDSAINVMPTTIGSTPMTTAVCTRRTTTSIGTLTTMRISFSEMITAVNRKMHLSPIAVFYSPDGQWAFLKNTDTRYQTVPTSSGSTLCPMNTTVETQVQTRY